MDVMTGLLKNINTIDGTIDCKNIIKFIKLIHFGSNFLKLLVIPKYFFLN